MKIIQKLILLIILLLNGYVYSQNNPEIDSLIKVIENSDRDTNYVINLNKICWSLKTSDNIKAISFGNKAIKVAQDILYIRGEAKANKNMGGVYFLKSDYTSAYLHYTRSLELYNELEDKMNIARVVRNLGSVFHQQGNYEKALKYFFESLEMRFELDDKKGVATLYNAIGLVNLEQGEEMYETALEYFFDALKIYKEIDSQKGIAKCYNRIGTVYSQYSKPIYELALDYNWKIIPIGEQLNDKRLLAQANETIGLIYLKTDSLEKAYEVIMKSLNLWQELNSSFGVANAYQNLGVYYLKKKNYSKSKEYFLKTYNISKEIKAPVIERNINLEQKKLYIQIADYKKAMKYNDRYHFLKDSLKSEEMTDLFTKMELQLEFNKQIKNKELEQQTYKIQQDVKLNKQKQLSVFFIIAFILMLFLAIVILRSYKQKKVVNDLLKTKNYEIITKNSSLLKHQNEIEKQRDEIQEQRDILIIQNDEISKQQSQITKSIKYAKRIQKAILPPDELLKTIFEQHYIFFKPRDIVSGDFYWALKKEHLSIIAAADCTGHGIPGAFMSMLGISFLNHIINNTPTKKIRADLILNELRSYVKKSLRQTGKIEESKDGLDIALCIFDFEKQYLNYAGAYNPLIIIRENKCIEYKADRMPIGIYLKEKPFKNNIIKIKKGDHIYIYSDGYIDQFGGIDGRKFSSKQLKNLLIKNSNLDLNKQNDMLDNTLINWMDTKKSKVKFEQLDDIIIIGIKI